MANTSKGVVFMPPSEAYVRSLLYLLYTLIKLHHTKALSDQASSLAPDWILLLQRPRIPASFWCSATTFQGEDGGSDLWYETSRYEEISVLKYLKTPVDEGMNHATTGGRDFQLRRAPHREALLHKHTCSDRRRQEVFKEERKIEISSQRQQQCRADCATGPEIMV